MNNTINNNHNIIINHLSFKDRHILLNFLNDLVCMDCKSNILYDYNQDYREDLEKSLEKLKLILLGD